MKDRIGALLLRHGIIDAEQLEKARDFVHTQEEKTPISVALIKLSILSEDDLLEFLVRNLEYPSVTLEDVDINPDVAKLIPTDMAQKYRAIPYAQIDNTLKVAMADPTDLDAIDDIRFRTRLEVDVSVALESEIKQSLDKYYDTGLKVGEMMEGFSDDDMDVAQDVDDSDISDIEAMAKDSKVVKMVNYILMQAIQRKASDIHIEPYEKSYRVRLRIDGSLYELIKPPLSLRNPITSRVKIMASLDIAERRLPQDGRIKLKLGRGKDMDFRVSVLPTLFGEKVVMRLLDKSNLMLDMTKLGFEETPLKWFKEAIHKPFGMVLVTGPTGSGKTTTLYSALQELNTPTENVSTAEDPVEFNLAGINQVQMHEEVGLTFASALRSFLRQDPDIIMVGEIRDFETAEIAVKAALTGHLVLSTLHTNDAPQTVNRMLNMGVEPFLVASAVNLIVAQRLARKVCLECKEEDEVPPEALRDLGVKMEDIDSGVTVYKGRGCPVCNNTGYKGRVALYEVMPIWDELKELILAGASALELKKDAVRLGMQTLRMSAINKLKEGITTVQEVGRCTMPD
ncbi:MAG: type IV-A pilus assembly ATPase PilB [Thermodesulfobacteriota bacterium]